MTEFNRHETPEYLELAILAFRGMIEEREKCLPAHLLCAGCRHTCKAHLRSEVHFECFKREEK